MTQHKRTLRTPRTSATSATGSSIPHWPTPGTIRLVLGSLERLTVNGEPPTVRMVAQDVGMSSATANYAIRALAQGGVLVLGRHGRVVSVSKMDAAKAIRSVDVAKAKATVVEGP